MRESTPRVSSSPLAQAQALNGWFIVDLLLNFVTGYVSREGLLIMSKRALARRALKNPLVLAVVAVERSSSQSYVALVARAASFLFE